MATDEGQGGVWRVGRENGCSLGQPGGRPISLMLFLGQAFVQPLSCGHVPPLFGSAIPPGHTNVGKWKMAEGCAAGCWHAVPKSCYYPEDSLLLKQP